MLKITIVFTHLNMHLCAWNYFAIHDINQNGRVHYRRFKCPNLITWDLLRSAISIMFSFLFCECSKQLITQDVLNFFARCQVLKEVINMKWGNLWIEAKQKLLSYFWHSLMNKWIVCNVCQWVQVNVHGDLKYIASLYLILNQHSKPKEFKK